MALFTTPNLPFFLSLPSPSRNRTCFINPTAAGIFGSYYPVGPRRVLVMCIFGGAGPTGFTMGSLFRVSLPSLEVLGLGFYAECIACAVFALLSYFFIPANIGHVWTTKQTFDYLGAITGVCGLILSTLLGTKAPL